MKIELQLEPDPIASNPLSPMLKQSNDRSPNDRFPNDPSMLGVFRKLHFRS